MGLGHLHPASPSKQKRKRRKINPGEQLALEQVFQSSSHPNTAMRNLLGTRLGMSPRSVQIWFQNRRAKAKKDFVPASLAAISNMGNYGPDLEAASSEETTRPTSSPCKKRSFRSFSASDDSADDSSKEDHPSPLHDKLIAQFKEHLLGSARPSFDELTTAGGDSRSLKPSRAPSPVSSAQALPGGPPNLVDVVPSDTSLISSSVGRSSAPTCPSPPPSPSSSPDPWIFHFSSRDSPLPHCVDARASPSQLSLSRLMDRLSHTFNGTELDGAAAGLLGLSTESSRPGFSFLSRQLPPMVLNPPPLIPETLWNSMMKLPSLQAKTILPSSPSSPIKSKESLVNAALLGFERQVQDLIEHRGCHPDDRDEYGNTALIVAASRGYLNIVNFLLQHAASTNLVNKNGGNALIQAVSNGYLDVVEALLPHCSPSDHHQQDVDEGRTCLHFAVIKGYWRLLSQFMKGGSDVAQRDKKGQTALHYAAFKGNVDCAVVLLENGANINDCDENGCTPLMVAALYGHQILVHCLLSWGADPRRVDTQGNTALTYAIQGNPPDLALVNLVERWISNPGLLSSSASLSTPLSQPGAMMSESFPSSTSVGTWKNHPWNFGSTGAFRGGGLEGHLKRGL